MWSIVSTFLTKKCIKVMAQKLFLLHIPCDSIWKLFFIQLIIVFCDIFNLPPIILALETNKYKIFVIKWNKRKLPKNNWIFSPFLYLVFRSLEIFHGFFLYYMMIYFSIQFPFHIYAIFFALYTFFLHVVI